MTTKLAVIFGITAMMLTGLIGFTQAQAGELQSSLAPQSGVGTGFTYHGQLEGFRRCGGRQCCQRRTRQHWRRRR